ncbi:MAG: hypothetical protein QG675_287 [Patescibacteria group bacterium]|jgi:hypothetical protein|nr:hypothetical protein [Patescibacteria group bacterium]
MRIFVINFLSLYMLFGGFLGYSALKWTECDQPRRYISEPASEHFKFLVFMTFLWFPFFAILGILAFIDTKKPQSRAKQ